MRVCILQPSYIPWKGYFHQIALSDCFVFLDTVQYDRRGWRNRNQIKTPAGPTWLTIPVHAHGTHQGLLIQDVQVQDTRWAETHWAKIRQAYQKAPCYKQEAAAIETLLTSMAAQEQGISRLAAESTIQLAKHMGIAEGRTFLYASDLPFDTVSLEPSERLLRIAQHCGATAYLSGPSAQDYLDVALFQDAGIATEWMRYEYEEVEQLYPPFSHFVSIVDTLLTLGREQTKTIVSRPLSF